MGKIKLQRVFNNPAFNHFDYITVLSLIYRETTRKSKTTQKYNILVFDFETARKQTVSINYITNGGRRIHPVFKFYDAAGDYICEIRHGGATDNALQRGLWTNTKRASKHFESVMEDWTDYNPNPVLVRLFSYALLSTSTGHEEALKCLKADVEANKRGANIP